MCVAGWDVCVCGWLGCVCVAGWDVCVCVAGWDVCVCVTVERLLDDDEGLNVLGRPRLIV